MQAITKAELPLNPSKCTFDCSEIPFRGMIYSADGLKPDPAKMELLDHIDHNRWKYSSVLLELFRA